MLGAIGKLAGGLFGGGQAEKMIEQMMGSALLMNYQTFQLVCSIIKTVEEKPE